jgi:hypothetical protein
VDNVWGAAVAAQRINGSYVKETMYKVDPEMSSNTVVDKRRNRDIMLDILANPALLTVEDIAQGQECRKFLQNDITFRALKNKLTEFDGAVSKVLAVEDDFDSVKHKYELAVVACLPQSHARSLERQAVQDRVRQTSGDHVGNPGDKVLSPFMGIGSEGVMSLKYGRKFVGVELIPSFSGIVNIEFSAVGTLQNNEV